MKFLRRHARARWLRGCAAVLAVLIFVLAFPSGQRLCAAASSEKHRKVIYKVTPEYPDIAKKIKLSGTVKLSVQVGPNGRVLSTRILGGHPVLAKFATDAVQRWRFEPSLQSTEEVVQVDFEPEGTSHEKE